MSDLKEIDLVYCFQKKTLEAALEDWMKEQIKAYPKREKQIKITTAAMMDFMTSEHVSKHGMVVEQLVNQSTP